MLSMVMNRMTQPTAAVAVAAVAAAAAAEAVAVAEAFIIALGIVALEQERDRLAVGACQPLVWQMLVLLVLQQLVFIEHLRSPHQSHLPLYLPSPTRKEKLET